MAKFESFIQIEEFEVIELSLFYYRLNRKQKCFLYGLWEWAQRNKRPISNYLTNVRLDWTLLSNNKVFQDLYFLQKKV